MAFILHLGLIVSIVISVVCGSCPAGWHPNELAPGSCFYYIHTEATFNDAKRACQMVKGALVPPTTLTSTAALGTFIQTSDIVNKKQVWVDMMKNANDQWTTANGTEEIPGDYWYVGYPEGDGNCGVFLYSKLQVKNKECSLKASVVCEGFEDSVQAVTNTCPSLPLTEAQGDVVPGTYGYLECELGYRLSSSGHKKAFCRKDGSWSRTADELAWCQPKKCEPIHVGEKVLETSDESNDVGSRRNFTCQQGDKFRTQTASEYISVLCNDEGLWIDTKENFLTSIEDCVPQADDEVFDGSGVEALASHMSAYLLFTIILLAAPL
ncbi:uncharacterized protein [Watersipora subatra]|uniref:uncharacterized protein n=1 Tax=Watersipora subatra TaxID=2589382 RepID=UPI00355B4469